MNELLIILLRLAGLGLIALAFTHIPIAKTLSWRSDAARMSKANEAIFHVHAIFICLVLVMMGLPCVVEPGVFLEKSRAARWLSISYSIFWGIRLYFQWFVYQRELWYGKRLETFLHRLFTFIWAALSALFACCAFSQYG